MTAPRRRLPRPSHRPGVTLLEALIAMAIVGLAFGAMLQLQLQLVRGLSDIEQAEARAAWSRNASEIAASLANEKDRSGRIDLDGTRIVWVPAPGEAYMRPNRVGQRMRGRWSVRLAPVAFTVERNGRVLQHEVRYATTASRPAPAPAPP